MLPSGTVGMKVPEKTSDKFGLVIIIVVTNIIAINATKIVKSLSNILKLPL